MGVVFFALRDAPDGIAPVVIKVVRPELMAVSDIAVQKAVRKEVAALERLNARVPPTPFVVRFIDTGSLAVQALGVTLPWIAVEYVYGGVEGATLTERVRYSCENTGAAFDPLRASHALRSLGAGVAAVHDVGVIHRDLTPGNVLCCGFGEAEIFKVSDFGLARMQSLETFGRVLLGTPAYAAPEQNFNEGPDVGTYSDVFSLACIAFYLLAGEPYFDAKSVPEALVAVRASDRKSLLSTRFLAPELRQNTAACRAIDEILSRATAKDPGLRPAHAQALTSALAKALPRSDHEEAARASRRLVESVTSGRSPVEVRDWTWTVRHPAHADLALHAVAWESDGHCLAASTAGVLYWAGAAWESAPTALLGGEVPVRCVHRVRAGTWVLGGSEALAVYSTSGIESVLASPGVSFQHVSGHLEDVLLLVSDRVAGSPTVHCLVDGRWQTTLDAGEFRTISSVARIGPTSWLLAGRRRDGSGGVALCRPLEGHLSFATIPPSRAMLSTASQSDRELGLAVGTHGAVVAVQASAVVCTVLEGEPNLSACGVDILDREWAGSAGRLWVKEPAQASGWRTVWESSSLTTPFVSIMAEVGMVLAVTADGGVLEGRAPWRA